MDQAEFQYWTSVLNRLTTAQRVPSEPVPDPRIEVPLAALGAVRLEPAAGAGPHLATAAKSEIWKKETMPRPRPKGIKPETKS